MDRGVSDVLGYVLIFALITSSVGVVTVAGYGALEDVRAAQRFENAERAFEMLRANVADHLENRVPSRSTGIQLADARLGFGDPVTITVSVEGVGTNRTTLEPIVYSAGQTGRIVYASGAVIRSEAGGSVMTAEPPFRFGNPMFITMVDTRGHGTGIAGSARVLVRTELLSQSVHAYTDGPYDLWVNVTTPRPGAWISWLEAETGSDCVLAGDTVSCPVEAETVYVRTVTIDVYLD
ncbi:MAG: hypothetical protein ABEJ60_00860 [Halodesulfurarchaeum sp.]